MDTWDFVDIDSCGFPDQPNEREEDVFGHSHEEKDFEVANG